MAGLSLGPLPANGGQWHNTLTWDALNESGSVVVKSRYTEDGPRDRVNQKFALAVASAPAGSSLMVQLNGVDLMPIQTDDHGRAVVTFTSHSPRGGDGRPPSGRRIEEGDVVRVYSPALGVDVSASYWFYYDE
ncbi:MAG: hypothetical protein EYC70_02225 [Planctomycetota bacterium]|nr:MAG: hypothetical protein EYC70_02225 [Planctomycetota bacterium]